MLVHRSPVRVLLAGVATAALCQASSAVAQTSGPATSQAPSPQSTGIAPPSQVTAPSPSLSESVPPAPSPVTNVPSGRSSVDPTTTSGAPAGGATVGEVVVTARRRAENIQKVPVSVQAFNEQGLGARSIENTQDLQRAVPGVVFQGSGSVENTTLAIRGQGRDVIGAPLSSVISYVNEVPLPTIASIVPTYDIGSLQVLKGPQGTLFGRNTTGGALLVYTQKPTYDFGGYAQAQGGDYADQEYQGAINIPIVDQKLAVRLAGDYEKRAGYTQFVGPGGGYQDDKDFKSFRISVLAQPTSYITNTTVFDFNQSRTHGSSAILIGQSPEPIYDFGSAAFGPVLGPLITAGFACTTSIDCNVDQQIARQKAVGVRTAFSDVPTYNHAKTLGVENTTEIALGPVNFKNIVGYRDINLLQPLNTDGTTNPLINTVFYQNYGQVTEEAQFSGKLFDDRVQWLVGGFFLDSRPNGPDALIEDVFRPAFIPQNIPLVGSISNDFYSDESEAAFGNVVIHLTSKLNFNAGIRHTWDREGVCADSYQPITQPVDANRQACVARGDEQDRYVSFDATTWQVGADYQLTPSVFTYVVGRRGYKAGGLNTPELGGTLTPFQTYQPQTVTDVEIGVKTNFDFYGVKGRFNIDGFRGEFSNLQRQINGIPPNFDGDNNPADDPAETSVTVNAGSSRVQGVEIDSTVVPIDGLTLNAAISYLDAKFTSETLPATFQALSGQSQLPYEYAPEVSYTFSGRYKIPFALGTTSFFLNGDYYHTDSYFVALSQIPGYNLANLSVEADNMFGKAITGTFFVTNVGNTTYETSADLSGSSPGVFVSTFGPPRMYGVRVRYSF